METEKTLLTRLAWMTILILLVGWCILREIAFSRQVLERRPHTMTNPPRTNLTYQYILCTQNSPCSPMAEYYVSPLCYGYLDSHSGTGSPGILGIHDIHPFSGGEDSKAKYICTIGGASYETFFLYFF